MTFIAIALVGVVGFRLGVVVGSWREQRRALRFDCEE
jgi:hypothetical protein